MIGRVIGCATCHHGEEFMIWNKLRKSDFSFRNIECRHPPACASLCGYVEKIVLGSWIKTLRLTKTNLLEKANNHP